MEILDWYSEAIADVFAIERMVSDSFESGKDSYITLFSERKFDQIVKINEALTLNINQFRTEAKIVDEVQNISQALYKKLIDVRALCLNGKWESQVEVAQWVGFLSGAGFVHWARIERIGKEVRDRNLLNASNVGVKYHQEMLNLTKDKIKTL